MIFGDVLLGGTEVHHAMAQWASAFHARVLAEGSEPHCVGVGHSIGAAQVGVAVAFV